MNKFAIGAVAALALTACSAEPEAELRTDLFGPVEYCNLIDGGPLVAAWADDVVSESDDAVIYLLQTPDAPDALDRVHAFADRMRVEGPQFMRYADEVAMTVDDEAVAQEVRDLAAEFLGTANQLVEAADASGDPNDFAEVIATSDSAAWNGITDWDVLTPYTETHCTP